MLVLQRKLLECIDITLPDGRVIVVQVIQFRQTDGGQKAVRLGIEAPPDVTIHRREITNRIEATHEELGGDNA